VFTVVVSVVVVVVVSVVVSVVVVITTSLPNLTTGLETVRFLALSLTAVTL